MQQFDAILIGSGQAATPLATQLAHKGRKVVLIEQTYIAGTCINWGCTPTKTMVASAKNIYQAKRSKEYGFTTGAITVDLPAIIARKEKVVTTFRAGSENRLKKESNIKVVYGVASFTGNKVVQVKTTSGAVEEYTAEHIFINTGAATTIPAIKGLDSVPYLTSTTIMELQEIPEHLIIIGAGYVALEFGQMFLRFGSKVTIVQRSQRFLPKEDPDIADEMKKILEEDGITFKLDANPQSVQLSGSKKIILTVTADGKNTDLEGSHLLIAAGRSPNTRSLHLDKTGVETDEKEFIKVNDRLETNVSGIYALGDVKPGPAFTHISYNDYLVVTKNLLENGNVSIKGRFVPYCVFTDPELARVGITEEEARSKGIPVKIAKLPMAYVARGVEMGETRGVMKAVVDAGTKQILGVSIIGFGAGELMSLLQIAMLGKVTSDQLKDNIFAHPTWSESINNLFMNLDE
ncbi:mercuric reductase [Niastella yeongjuensis]|uniref:Mercuric reductase n=1 Tax=Niastella yeongjuensis TaxID=354355 RepID=A0A1V9E3V4_9BACT|nr:mercuric reductase [Niastella yeongjuensis]OQP40776.1 mercuric reductase [Niastella yeongjuensis]SEP02065.1 Pyruvate/2-oxoglutarate dehydrogenase complex, dihydrolipoamide dehydrogenase (E3) component [Niastella yeongjuensis]